MCENTLFFVVFGDFLSIFFFFGPLHLPFFAAFRFLTGSTGFHSHVSCFSSYRAVHFVRYIFDWRRESKERELLVCTWRHGGHVGGQEQKHFSPLGTKLNFHVNSSRKYSFVLTPNMAALSRGCKPRIRQAVFQPVSLTSSCSIKLETFNFSAKNAPVSDRLDLSPYLRRSRYF